MNKFIQNQICFLVVVLLFSTYASANTIALNLNNTKNESFIFIDHFFNEINHNGNTIEEQNNEYWVTVNSLIELSTPINELSNEYFAGGTLPEDDFDDDGVINKDDIDDDNDGVLDATESPSCFYTKEEASTVTVTTELVTRAGSGIERAFDKNTNTYSAFNNNQPWTGKIVFDITPSTPVAATSVNFDIGPWYISNGSTSTFKLVGVKADNSTEDLSSSISHTNTNDLSIPIPVANQNTKYKKFRIVGVNGTSYLAGVNEITLTLNSNYSASAHPKPNCAISSITDKDNDGFPNHFDLDSDGDSCSDAYEAGATTDTSSDYQFPANNVGANGLANTIETSDSDNATTTYTNTYNVYAINSSLNFCIDSDDDNVPDLVDLDDDNDGILDSEEMGQCESNDAADENNWLVWDFEKNHHTLSTDYYNETTITPHTTRNFGSGLSDVSGSNVHRFNGATETSFQNAIAANDYLQFNFTTENTVLTIDKKVNYTIAPASLKQGIIISTDPSFANYIVLDDGTTPNTDTSPWMNNNLNILDDYILDVNTTYYLRYIYYGAPAPTGHGDVDAMGLSFNQVTNGNVCNKDIDTDGDGIPNRLDLDSDGDGCPDALEGGDNFTVIELEDSEMDGGNKDTEDSTYTGDSDNPVISNLGNDVDEDEASASYGVPKVAKSGQSVGDSQNGAVLSAECATFLPVELIEFTAKAVRADVELTWSTATELNNSHFNIERSIDGVNFEVIGRVNGVGTTRLVQNYSFTDLNAATLGNVLYYRLNQIDFDGTSANSKIEQVNFEGVNMVSIMYPNPVQGGGDIILEGEDIERVEVYTIHGILVGSYNQKNQKTMSIPTSNFTSGTYMVIINGKERKNLVVIN